MRGLVLPALAAFVAVAAGCPSSDSSPAGKGVGESCAAARECRAGLVCSVRHCAVAEVPATACGLPVIELGPTLDPGAYTSCVTPVRTPVFPVQPLGDLQVGRTGTFTVDPGTTSFTIFSQEIGTTAVDTIDYQGYTIPNTVVPTDILRPGGSLFFSDTDSIPTDDHGHPDATGLLGFYAGFTPTMGAFTSPNTSAALDLVRSAGELPVGPWTFTANDWARECLSIAGCQLGSTTGVYGIQVATNAKDMRSPGTLDLEIYVATDPLLSSVRSAAAAVSDPAVRPQIDRMVRGIAAYYAQAGVCIGTVTFHDLPDWAKQSFALGGKVNVASDGPCGDLSQLFTLALAPSAAVHIFLADALDAGPTTSGRMVLGVDGAIPGPSGVPGTITSGAIVGLFDLLGYELAPGACAGASSSLSTCGTDILAYVAAHEAGHWLGLYHTTEMPGGSFDPLSDTPTCPCLSCAPLSRRVTCLDVGVVKDFQVMESSFCTGDTTCGGTRNLMFWLLDEDLSAGELTPEQGEVVRLNPAVH